MMKYPKHLLYVNDCKIGFKRIKTGKEFYYINENDKKITNKKIITRITSLGIPPAWEKVWIGKEAKGHLQAYGFDERGRKQYIYHPEWATYRNLTKFEDLYKFGQDLSKIRQQVWQDLALKGWPKQKVVALAISILDETYIRVGNKFYSETNNTYGLTTLRRRHLKENAEGCIIFSYAAKGNKKLKIDIENKKLCKLIKGCAELPGHSLFQYINENDSKLYPLTSLDINNYLHTITKKRYTAKNFRTWGGSVTALEQFEEALNLVAKNPRLKLVNVIIKEVSKVLTNTIAICRKYYIHPAILDAIEKQQINSFLKQKLTSKKYAELDFYEKQMMIILKNYYKQN